MKNRRIFVLSLLLLVALFRLPAWAGGQPAGNPLIIDVRTDGEWREGHLQGAILIPHEKIGEEIVRVAPEKNREIRLYCRTGRRSGLALDVLKKLGYEHVTNDGSVKDASEKLNVPVVK